MRSKNSVHLSQIFDRWYAPAIALINHFYYKDLPEIPGCMSVTACNYNPDATKDDGGCETAQNGYDCNGNKLTADADGATYFISTKSASQLVKSLSHAEVDLPENFEMGFEITPNEQTLKTWSNIVHFTATGKVISPPWLSRAGGADGLRFVTANVWDA